MRKQVLSWFVKVILITITSCCFSIFSPAQQYSKFVTDSLERLKANPSLIIWDKNRKLTFADFQGMPDTTSGANAVTSCEFVAIWDDDEYTIDTVLVCVFNKKESWIKPGVSDLYTLQHEQGHFDITQLFTRKLMRKLSFFANIWPRPEIDVDSFYDEIMKEHERMQVEYDKATSHKVDWATQNTWAKKICKYMELF